MTMDRGNITEVVIEHRRQEVALMMVHKKHQAVVYISQRHLKCQTFQIASES